MSKPVKGRTPRFADKVVIVTGAAQGIGRGVAESIAAEGGTVFAVDRSPIVHEVVDAITAAGGKAAAHEADLETFAGAKRTYSVELVIPDGKALQGGTSHNLADHFAKVFDI